ncbi:MAG: aminotransferase class I/II-fold pyridoxal phosphate-dependent enzyme [Thermomicrobiales bacterium]|nr:aminotransferase class I/II-fold pyridoxal phosphate-dependent enzyme [Thermomicrobiales bacterium]
MYGERTQQATSGVVDLRSDTVTHPTDAMRAAMAAAIVGDDQNGEDPTVNALEDHCAELLGKEAGVFMPSGTMGNLSSVITHCRPGQMVVLGDRCHILGSESGGIAALGGVMPRAVPTNANGTLQLETIALATGPSTPGSPQPALIAVENTHNFCGGTVLSQAYLAEVRALADERGLPIHMDGARIFNAAAYLGIPARDIAAHADSVQFCFSKGLGAPVGSMVVGTKVFIDQVRIRRKLLGGAMRQAGVIAAAAQVAMETMIDRLSEDHARARVIADAIAEYPAFDINTDTVQTNIVIFKPRKDAQAVVAALRERGVLSVSLGAAGIRLVTHYHIDDNAVDRVVYAIGEVAHA